MVNLITQNGLLYVSPPLEEFKTLLTFDLKRMEPQTVERVINGVARTINTGFKFAIRPQTLYWETPDNQQLVTYHNLIHRLADYCAERQFPINVVHRTEYVSPIVTAETVRGLRPEQVRAFAKMVSMRGGAMLEATMSTGKTLIIAALVRAYKHAKSIVITTHREAVVKRLEEGLNEALAQEGIQVSVMTGRRKIQRSHVLVCTSACLENLDPMSVDLLIFDEVHRAGGDKTGQTIAHFLKAIKYGLSGTISKRQDNKQVYLEAIFGPIADTIDDAEAEQLQRVSPVRCYALSVPKGPDVRELKSQYKLEEKAVTTNVIRNDLIRQVVSLAPADQQLIIFVRTTDHMEELMKKYLTGFEAYHASLKESEKRRILAGIEDGSILRIVTTDCLEEGVDTTELCILIDANWTSSDRSVSQKGGRNRRLKEGKNWGVIVNFQDEWCDVMRHNTIERLTGMNVPVPDDIKQMDRLKRRANTRLSQYRDRGWSVERIDVPSEIEFDTGQAPEKDGVQQENFQEEETDLDPTK